MIFARYDDNDIGVIIGEGLTLDKAFLSLKEVSERSMDYELIDPNQITFWEAKKLNVKSVSSVIFTLEE